MAFLLQGAPVVSVIPVPPMCVSYAQNVLLKRDGASGKQPGSILHSLFIFERSRRLRTILSVRIVPALREHTKQERENEDEDA